MTDDKKQGYQLLFLISSQKVAEKAEEFFAEEHMPIQYQATAKGTASDEIIDMLGLGSTDKSVVISVLPRSAAQSLLHKAEHRLHLGMPGTGIAFTVPLTAGNAAMIHLLHSAASNQTNHTGKDVNNVPCEYSLIMTFVNQGFSEEVMAAAKTAGAGGGTVFHCRRVETEEALHFWGVSIQQEREIVLILAASDRKLAIMEAIGKSCGAQSDAQGLVISLPVNGVAGLAKD